MEITKLDKLCIKWLNENYNNMEPFIMKEYTDYIFYMKDGKCILQHNKKSGYVYVSYREIWSFFEHMFSMSNQQIKDIIKIWMEEHYKMGVKSIEIAMGAQKWVVEEHYQEIQITNNQNEFYFNRDVEELYNQHTDG
jgi:hypothetical protein